MGSCKVAGIIVGIVAFVVFLTVVVVLFKSFNKVATSEVAVAHDTWNNEIYSDVYNEGLHIIRPTLSLIKFPSIFQTLGFPGKRCLNEDGVTVTLSINLQYRLRPTWIKAVLDEFKNKENHYKMLKYLGNAAIHDICCQFNMTELLARRGELAQKLADRFVEKFNTMHTDVQDVQVNDISRPYRYEAAIKAKESAREDIEVGRSEKPQALTAANTTKREAVSEANIIINHANSDAKIVFTKAKAEAEAILNDFEKEAESYKQLKEDNGLDNAGFLAYMGVRAIASAKNPVYVSMDGPARTSYEDL